MKKMGMLLGLLMLGVATPSLAGLRYGLTVHINTTVRYASGALGAVRNSPDTVQYIGCDSYSDGYGYCYAADENGAYANCGTTDPDLVAVIRSMNSDSFVLFIYDAQGDCTEIRSAAASVYEPKAP